MNLRLIVLTFLAAVTLRGAEALPLFNATLTVGKEHRFVLVDSKGKASPFLSLGESFSGYTLKSYDAKAGALELERDGHVSRVSLVSDASVAHAAAIPLPATMADAQGVLNKMRFEEMIERGMQGQRKMLASQFQRTAAQMTAQGADPAEVAAFQKKITDEIFGALDPKALKDDVSKIYSEVFSKQELDELSAFYSTPLGAMLTTKQMDVQEKLGAVIQGKMAEMMPRVQQMSRDFSAQQKAKREAAGGAAPAPRPQQAPPAKNP
jgi:hypothetical protein